MPRRLAQAVVLVLAVALGACGGSSDDASTPQPSTGGATSADAPLAGHLTVAAAASLTEAFTDLGDAFEAAHPEVEITFTFDSSGTLRQQIIDGAPIDLFASADPTNMDEVVRAGLTAGDPVPFARNRLAIVTKPGNPAHITSLADLADAGVIALCGEEVPCGTYAAAVLEDAGVAVPETSVTRAQNAKAALTAVSEGDAVAGIVYVTDARAAGDAVDTVAIPEDRNAAATYLVAVLRRTEERSLATAFADFVRSDAGSAALASRGFRPPP